MTVSTWTGGTHKIIALDAWTPSSPVSSDDAGVITSGHAIAIHQTVGPYSTFLDGVDASSATLDALDSTFTGFLGGSFMADPTGQNPSPYGTVGLLGMNINDGTIGTYSNYNEAPIYPKLDINLADISSPTAVIQQAILINNKGTLTSGENAPVTITGSADALLVNNGTISAEGNFDIGVAVTGTGTIEKMVTGREQNSVLTLEKSVSAGQTLVVDSGEVIVEDPLNFRATVSFPEFSEGYIDFKTAVTSASFINNVLSLFDNSSLVAQFRVSSDSTASDIAILGDGNGGTEIRDSYGMYASPIFLITTGAVPTAPPIVLPGSVTTLSRSGSDIKDFDNALVASAQKIDGYSLTFTNGFDTTQASLSISSVTLGPNFALDVASHRYGDLYAVGNNQNAGLIETAHGSSLHVAVSDMAGADGVSLVSGTFTNSGQITAQNGSTISITGSADSKLINAGSILDRGMVFIGPNLGGIGTVTIGATGGTGAHLEFGGSVGYGQDIKFSAGTLTVDDAKDFHATIYDFSSIDALVLKNVDVRSMTYGNGTLRLDGGVDGLIKLAGPSGRAFKASSFEVFHSGQDSIITTAVRTA